MNNIPIQLGYCELNKNILFDTFRSIKLSKAASSYLVAKFTKIEKDRGLKGLLTQINDVRDALLELHSKNSRKELIDRYKQYKTGKGPKASKVLLGIYLPLFAVSLAKGGLDHVLNAISFEGYFESKPATKSDYISAIAKLKNRGPDPFNREEDKIVEKLLQSLPKTSPLVGDNDFTLEYPHTNKSHFIKVGESSKGYKTTPSDIVRALFSIPHCVTENFDYFKFLVGNSLMPEFDEFNLEQEDIAGKYVLIPKYQTKYRGIFSSSVILQLALSPLHNMLKSRLKAERNCFCFDQDAGTAWVLEQFALGKSLTSLDLSSASDNIPLTPQLLFLDSVFPANPFKASMLDIFERACKMKWVVPEFPELYLAHQLGTPMGLRAAYYLFTFWLLESFKSMGMNGKFAIVGDDIVFHSKYEKEVLYFFDKYQIPINLSKSILSSQYLAEFCGRKIFRDRILAFTKAKLPSVSNPLTTIRRLGLRSFSFIREFSKYKKGNTLSVKMLTSLGKVEQEPTLQTVLDTLIDYADNKKDSNATFSQGGYTLHQFFRLGVLTLTEFHALRQVVAFQKAFPQDIERFQVLLKTNLVYRDFRTKKLVTEGLIETCLPLYNNKEHYQRVKDINLRNRILRVSNTFGLRFSKDKDKFIGKDVRKGLIAPHREFRSKYKDYTSSHALSYQYHMDYLQDKARDIPQLDHLVPIFNYHGGSPDRFYHDLKVDMDARISETHEVYPHESLTEQFGKFNGNAKAPDILGEASSQILKESVEDKSFSNDPLEGVIISDEVLELLPRQKDQVLHDQKLGSLYYKLQVELSDISDLQKTLTSNTMSASKKSSMIQIVLHKFFGMISRFSK